MSTPLQTALDAQRPIPTDREELEIDRLLDADQRRTVSVSPEEHLAWRESLAPKSPIDEIDEFLSELRSIKPEGAQ